jgi:hypothetical protein
MDYAYPFIPVTQYDGTNSATVISDAEAQPQIVNASITSETGGVLVIDIEYDDGTGTQHYPHTLNTGDWLTLNGEGSVVSSADFAQSWALK